MSESLHHAPIDAALLPHDIKVQLAQARMKQMPQVFIPTKTYVGHGMVTRVMMAPAGAVIIGKRHLQGQHNHLMLGTIELATEDGPVRLTGPEVIVSPPGTKRAAIAITDVIWSTTLATDLSPEEIERQLIAPEDRDDLDQIEEGEQP